MIDPNNSYISIPYGTIISRDKGLVDRQFPISIPYGTIISERIDKPGRALGHFNSIWYDYKRTKSGMP